MFTEILADAPEGLRIFLELRHRSEYQKSPSGSFGSGATWPTKICNTLNCSWINEFTKHYFLFKCAGATICSHPRLFHIHNSFLDFLNHCEYLKLTRVELKKKKIFCNLSPFPVHRKCALSYTASKFVAAW